MKQSSDHRWTLKDKLDMAEAICTIIVTIMALWGTIAAYRSHLFHKVSHLIDHYHAEIAKVETELSAKEKTIPVLPKTS